MTEVEINEEELLFKRFPAEKQDQIRSLVNYATLMGLSGKDLVSIGGKLDRIKEANQRKHNIAIAQGFKCFEYGNKPVKNRYYYSGDPIDVKFKLKTTAGDYNFTFGDQYYRIKSVSTGVTRVHYLHNAYSVGRMPYMRRYRYWCLLDISNGHLVLDF